MTDLGEIVQGSYKKLAVLFEDAAGADVDPTTVALHVMEGDDTETDKTIGDFLNPATGSFKYPHRFDIVGPFEGSWWGETAASSSGVVVNFRGTVLRRA